MTGSSLGISMEEVINTVNLWERDKRSNRRFNKLLLQEESGNSCGQQTRQGSTN